MIQTNEHKKQILTKDEKNAAISALAKNNEK